MLDEAAFATDVTFTKGPGGESAVDGQRVSEAGVARGMGRIAGGRVYGHQVGVDMKLAAGSPSFVDRQLWIPLAGREADFSPMPAPGHGSANIWRDGV